MVFEVMVVTGLSGVCAGRQFVLLLALWVDSRYVSEVFASRS